MQHIIINNIKQAPPLYVRRQEIIYYGWRAREWGRNDGRDYINTIILIFNGGGGMGG